MEFLITLIGTTLAVLVLREPIRRAPALFYLAAIVAVVLYFAGTFGYLGYWWRPLIPLVRRCMVALSLFTIVMFIGVLPKGSRLDAWLRPIRAELSIIACILCFGHMCLYLEPYATHAASGTLAGNVLVSFIAACVLFALVLLLGVTSLGFVKRRTGTRPWKNIQRLAYPFFILAYVHVLFMLVPSAQRGGEQAVISVVLYSVVFVAYIVLRLLRAYKDRQDEGRDDQPLLVMAS